MAEKKAVGHAYNIDFLNVVFAASSIFLFVSTIWMVWDDFDREWKNTQRQFTQLELEVTRAAARADRARHRQARSCSGLQQQLGAAQKAMEANRQQHRRDQRPAVGGRRPALPREQGGAVRQGDLRRQPVRVRGEAEGESRGRRRAAEGDRGRGAAPARAQPRGRRRVEAERDGAAGRAREVHLGGRPAAEGARRGRRSSRPGFSAWSRPSSRAS